MTTARSVRRLSRSRTPGAGRTSLSDAYSNILLTVLALAYAGSLLSAPAQWSKLTTSAAQHWVDDASRSSLAVAALASCALVSLFGLAVRVGPVALTLLDPKVYLDLVNVAYAGALGGSTIAPADLAGGDRVVKDVQAVFAQRGINNGYLNHFASARALLRPRPSRETHPGHQRHAYELSPQWSISGWPACPGHTEMCKDV